MMQQMHIVGERCPDKHTALQSLALRRAVHRFVKERGSPLPKCSSLKPSATAYWNLHKGQLDTMPYYLAEFGAPFKNLTPEFTC